MSNEFTSWGLERVNRVEVIGPGGRLFVGYVQPGIAVSMQDDGLTIKVFVGDSVEPKATGKVGSPVAHNKSRAPGI